MQDTHMSDLGPNSTGIKKKSDEDLNGEKLGKVEVFEKQLDSFFVRSAKEKEKDFESNSGSWKRGNENMKNEESTSFTSPKHVSGRKQGEVSPNDLNAGLSSIQNAFGKIFNNTKNFGRQVVENVSNSGQKSPQRIEQSSSPTNVAGGNENPPKTSSNIISNVHPIIDQTSTVLSGFKSNIVSFGNNIFEQFSNAVKTKDFEDGSAGGNFVNDLVLFVEYDKTKSRSFNKVQEHVRFVLYSQTKYPYISSRINIRIESGGPDDNKTFSEPYDSIKSSYESSASKASALLNEKYKKASVTVAKKNLGVIYITNIVTSSNLANDQGKQYYGLYTKLISENGFTELSTYNLSPTLPTDRQLEINPFFSDNMIHSGVDISLRIVMGEIYEWMITESKPTAPKSSGTQHSLEQHSFTHDSENQPANTDLNPW